MAKKSGAQKTQITKKPALKIVDKRAKTSVDSSSAPIDSGAAAESETGPSGPTSQKEQKVMARLTLTLDAKQRKSTSVVYKLGAGLRGSVRIAKTAFPGGVAPDSLDLESDVENAFAQPKAKLTSEQRKEARKNAPKQTPAQKLAALQERARKLQAKIDAQNAAGATA